MAHPALVKTAGVSPCAVVGWTDPQWLEAGQQGVALLGDVGQVEYLQQQQNNAVMGDKTGGRVHIPWGLGRPGALQQQGLQASSRMVRIKKKACDSRKTCT